MFYSERLLILLLNTIVVQHYDAKVSWLFS